MRRQSNRVYWLASRQNYVLVLLRAIQETNSLHISSVIRAVLTHWTAHHLAYRRLLEIRLSLQILVENDEKLELRNQQLLPGDASAWEGSRKNIAVIKNNGFWNALARYIILCYNSTFRAFGIPTTFVHSEQFIACSGSHARCKYCNIPATKLYSCSCIYKMRYDRLRRVRRAT
jgi:hypothetical protein